MTTEKNECVLLTGSGGFIGGYLVEHLLSQGYRVIGIDNLSKYGRVMRSFDDSPNYRFVEGDCKDQALMDELVAESNYVIAGAAMIGGISYFHSHAYDLLAENERILASTFDAAIKAHKNSDGFKRMVVMSSSMVYESTNLWPTPEGNQLKSPPPLSTYGFQKLATEYFAQGAWEQYQLPYTIVRPFNCVGIGEGRALSDVEILSGNVKLALSHVLPDLIQKVLKGQDPLHILGDGQQVRHYTHGKDLARGIVLAMESDVAVGNDFNLSTSRSTTVLELAELVWKTIHGEDRPFEWESDEAMLYDVQKRVPNTDKAKILLQFEAQISLEDAVKEVADWVRIEVENDRL